MADSEITVVKDEETSNDGAQGEPTKDGAATAQPLQNNKNTTPRKTMKDEIVEWLEVENELLQVIVLTGEAGVGKTWMAKAVSESAVEKENNCYGTIWISLDQKYTRESLYVDIARQFSLLTNADEWDDEEDTDDEKRKSEDETSENEKQMDAIDKAMLKMRERHLGKTKKEEKERGKVTKCKYLFWVLDEGSKMKEKEAHAESILKAARAKAEAEAKAQAKANDEADRGGLDQEKPKAEKEQGQDQEESDAQQDHGMSESSDKKTDLELLLQVLKWSNTRVLIATGRVSEEEIIDRILPKPLKAGELVYKLPFKHQLKRFEVPRLSCEELSELLLDCAKEYKNVPASTVEVFRKAIDGQNPFLPVDIIMMLGALNCIAEQHLQVQLPLKELKLEKDPTSWCLRAALAPITAQDPNSEADLKVATPAQVRNLEATLDAVIKSLVAGVDRVKELLLCALEALQANHGMSDHKIKAEGVTNCFWHRWDIYRARGHEDNKYIKLIKLEEIKAKQGIVNYEIKAKSVLDCFWHSRDFFNARCGGVHYNELIAYWILEGCFDPVDDLRNAYRKGHDVLMKLVDYGMIRLQEDNAIYMEGLNLKIKDGRFLGISATANLRMAKMLEQTNKWRGFGRIAPADGMIKTLRVGDKKKEELVSTLLVDGSCIHRETPEQLFLRTQKLHALGMFDAMLSDPTYSVKPQTHSPPVDQPKTTDSPSISSEPTKPPDSTSDPSKAVNPVVPGNSMADGPAPVEPSEAAAPLSSNPSKAADSTPSNQPKAAVIAYSESSQAADTTSSDLSEVKEDTRALIASTKNLQVLVFRRCYLLKELDFIKQLEALTALEVSGAILLKEIPDQLFEKTTQLRSLNLSDLRVESLPTTLSNLTELQRLILKRCSRLRTLPAIRKLEHLEVVDLGGCCSLEKMADMCLQSLVNLEILDLSYTRLQRMPIINSMTCLSQVLLKGCDNIGAMRKLANLTALTHLNISGVNKVREIHEDFLKGTENIEVVDLSGTGIEVLPPFVNPRVLNLKGCSKLKEIPELPDKTGCSDEAKKVPDLKGSLEFLDLSDASVLETINNHSFEHLENLQYLNFSNTKVKKLPSLNRLTKLQQLLLEGCSSLEELPKMEGLTGLKVFKLSGCKKLTSLPSFAGYEKLEDLDLSGCEALSEVPADSFQHLKLLQKLNLSETKIKSLPSFSECGNLQSLVLKNCKNLESFTRLEALSKLEELDLMGANKLVDVQAEYFKDLTALQILKLPKITAEELLKISILIKVKEFSLDSWSGDASAPWPTLEGLEVLEISDDAAESLKSLDSFSRLRKLTLRGSKWTKLPSLKSLVHLETLDLSGTGIEEFTEITDELSELPQFKCLRVPQLKLILKNACWEKLSRRSIYIDCENWEGSLPDGQKPFVMVQSTQFFNKWEASNQLTEALNRINFSIHSLKMQARKKNLNPGTWYSIHSKIRGFPPKQGQCFEIQGFDDYPADVTYALKEAEHVSLVDNKFLSCISDLYLEMRNSILKDKSIKSGDPIPEANKDNLHLEIQEKMKSCWLERCSEVTRIYKEPYTVLKVERELRFAVNLQILRISGLLKLKSFYEGGKRQCFENLKELYIDSCPMLETVFSSEQTMGNLHTLEIKFCGSLNTVFAHSVIEKPDDENVGEVKAVPKHQFATASNLKDLYISHCPMLETVYPSAEFPAKLLYLKIKFCDKLVNVFGNKEPTHPLSSNEPAPGESDPPEESDQSEVSNQPEAITTQASSEAVPIPYTNKLQVLRLCNCSMLESVYHQVQLPEEIGTLEIESCKKLKPEVKEWEQKLKRQWEPPIPDRITEEEDH